MPFSSFRSLAYSIISVLNPYVSTLYLSKYFFNNSLLMFVSRIFKYLSGIDLLLNNIAPEDLVARFVILSEYSTMYLCSFHVYN